MAPFSIFETFRLSKKKFFRAPQWELKLAVKILLGFIALYFIASFLLLGISAYFIAQKIAPNEAPVFFINSFLAYYFSVDLLIRYFVQSIPVTEIKPLLIQPISKSKIVLSVMLRSLGSFFNWVPLVILLPFCIVYTSNEPTTYKLWLWFLGILLFSGINNFLIFFINKSRLVAGGIAVVLICMYILQKGLGIPFFSFFEKGMDAIFVNPFWLAIPSLIFLSIVVLQYRFLKKELFLDKGLSRKKERIIGTGLSILDRTGVLGVFIKNDIRLILRNIRARQVFFMGGLFLFYGLIFFTQDIYFENPTMLIFAGIFTTGGFMLTFGQLVPAWDSEYYSFLMCQNIPYKMYLKSKIYLMMFSVVVSFILSLPYLYFGKKVMLILLASALFNFGLGSFITLFSGAYNGTPLKLNVKAKAFENTQNFNFTQFLFTLPKIVLPVVVFIIPNRILGFNAGLVSLGLTGLLGIILSRPLLNMIEKVYQKRKYLTLTSFKKN